MTKSYFKKGFALISSLSLVTSFLLYRIGTFDKLSINNQSSLYTSHNGGNINPSTIYTTKPGEVFITPITPLMLSSSKSMILTDKKPTFIDSLKKNRADYKYPKSENEILCSSKSAIIFKPKQTLIFKPKQTFNFNEYLKLKYDTLNTKKKKVQ